MTGRDVHAPAERYSEMGEVPTSVDTLLMSFRRGPVIAGMVISELYAVVNVLAYRLLAPYRLRRAQTWTTQIPIAFECHNICCRANT